MPKLRLCFATLFSCLLLATTAQAASIAIAWDPNAEPDVSGYVVLLGTAPGGTDQVIDVGTQTAWTFTQAVDGRPYYFRVQAYTAAGERSDPSDEVSGVAAASVPDQAAPFGFIDTPLDGVTGVTGSIAVTGWALDDVGVTRVRIYRDAVAGDASGSLVYIGDAAFVEGARPDVAAAFPGVPMNTHAGWGYLMLTNFLPNLGNGTFRIQAYAEDAAGRSTLLGMKTITCTNASATTPFGAIDTPSQGQAVSGTVTSFGWVLAPGSRRANPADGGAVQVVIDGVPVGSPQGWTNRADLTALFPSTDYSGIGSALGVFSFDSTRWTNGVHTIAWAVTDDQGSSAGVGSRYFTVSNGGVGSAVAAATAEVVSSSVATAAAAPLQGRRGFDLHAPFRTYRANGDGVITVQAEELDRVELRTGPARAFLATSDGLKSLPAGANMDAKGVFTWQPSVAFVGSYDFVFQGASGQRDVRIVLNPKGSGRVGPQVVIDTPTTQQNVGESFVVAGWAADLDAEVGTGVDAVHVWAYPVSGADPLYLGVASLNGTRPDVGAVYGDRFKKSGYGITVAGMAPGDYDLAVFAWSAVTQGFVPAKTVRVSVR